jgi:hypothetical protein
VVVLALQAGRLLEDWYELCDVVAAMMCQQEAVAGGAVAGAAAKGAVGVQGWQEAVAGAGATAGIGAVAGKVQTTDPERTQLGDVKQQADAEEPKRRMPGTRQLR